MMNAGSQLSAKLLVWIGLVLAGSIVLGLVSTPLAAQETSERVDFQTAVRGQISIEDSRLNVRSGPGISFGVVGKMTSGTVVDILEVSADGEWYRIQLDPIADESWVAAEFVVLIDETAGASVEGAESEPLQDATEDETSPGTTPSSAAIREESATVEGEADPSSAVDEASTTDDASSADDASSTNDDAQNNEIVLLPTPTPVKADATPTPESTTATENAGAAGLTITTPTATASAREAASLSATAAISETAVLDPETDDETSVDSDEMLEEPNLAEGAAGGLLPSPTPEADRSEAEASPTPTALVVTAPTATAPPTPTVQPTPTPDVATAVTQPANMNVRGGPGTSYAVVTTVTSGTALEILGVSPGGDWYLVDASTDADQAWVYGPLTDIVGPIQSVEMVPEEQIPPEPTAEPAPEPVAVAASPAASAPASLASAPPPSGAGFFGYGVQAHMLGGEVGQAMDATSNMGFNWIKQQVEWRLFQPQPGAIGFGDLHGIVQGANNRGISVLFSVVNAPQWAREPGFDGSVGGPPADPQTYANFVGAMAGEFCGTSLKAIEVWNEQNLHYEWGNKPLSPPEYMALLRPAYAAIKTACPSMLVISGALTPAGDNPPFAMDDFAYLEQMYQNGLKDYSDGIGAHPSGYNVPPSVRYEEACAVIQQTGNTFNGACDTPHHSWSFRSTMEGYRNIMVVYGDPNKRIWPTEFGWAAGGAFDPRYAYANDNGFDEQAAWTVEAYTMMRNWGWVGPAFLWNLNFRVVADGTEKAQWGIVRNDYTPLPVYDALRTMPK